MSTDSEDAVASKSWLQTNKLNVALLIGLAAFFWFVFGQPRLRAHNAIQHARNALAAVTSGESPIHELRQNGLFMASCPLDKQPSALCLAIASGEKESIMLDGDSYQRSYSGKPGDLVQYDFRDGQTTVMISVQKNKDGVPFLSALTMWQ